MPNITFPKVSLPVKLTIFGASISIALIGALATMLRRRRKKPKPYREISRLSSTSKDSTDRTAISSTYNFSNHTLGGSSRRNRISSQSKSPTQSKTPNGDVPSGSGARRSLSPAYQKMKRSSSASSVRSDAASTSTLLLEPVVDTSTYSAEQLCDMGLESLQAAIRHWEEAIERIDELEISSVSPEMESLQDQLHHLIGRAYHMRDHYEQKLFRQVSTHAALDAVIHEMDKEYQDQKRRSVTSGEGSSSDQDSFVSALDMADLSDLDRQKDIHQNLALYEAALLELTHGSIPCRSLRTRAVDVPSDTEFLAKLHCVRLALMDLFRDNTVRQWFSQIGRQLISDLLINAERDPEEFQAAYDDLTDYVTEITNWELIEQELRGRGVKVMTFYDIVLDFILFDAFDDLENPPSSVTTVVQNRWLSNGFKETALATAVWSVLKAKRRMLKFPRGFIAHFYAISEHVSPVLAWGFLGPSGHLKDLCCFFKEQVMEFIRDVFSFEKSRYTTVEQLADDIMRHARLYADRASVRLSS